MAKWKTRVDGSAAQIGQHYEQRESLYPYGAKRGASGVALAPVERSVDAFKKPVRAYSKKSSPKKPKKQGIKESPEYLAGFDKGLQEAAAVRFNVHKSESDAWKRGYDAGWRKGFRDPEYDEIVFINTEEDITAWEKRRAVMETEEFQTWFAHRYNTHPVPKNPYLAFMIDKSLKAKLKDRHEWAQRVNAADFQPIDYPPITKEPPPDITEPSPKTKEAQKTKRKLMERSNYLAKQMNIPRPEISFTTSRSKRARSFYRSGYGINRGTGEIREMAKPVIVIGIPSSGKLYPESYAVLAHEMGHHKTVIDLKRRGGTPAVFQHYSTMQTSRRAKIANEREAWKNADPYLKDHRAAQKWLKKYALGTYLGTTPGFRTKRLK